MVKIMEKLKRGTKHLTKNLIFWQYHHPYFKETNGECWLTPSEFEKRRESHRIATNAHTKKHPLMYILSGSIQRDRKKYHTPKMDLIDFKFIEELIKKQNGKCYWYNIDLEIDSIENSRNPAKLTIERLDCTKGYSKNNVVLCSYAANCGRGDCPIDLWLNIIKNIKNGLNTKSD